MKITILLLIIVLFLSITNVSFAEENTADKIIKGNVSFSASKYILGPNDVINISFLGIPELEMKSVRIQPSGNISIPVIGCINISGISIEEAQEKIETESIGYLNNPHIAINLVEPKSFIVYITGAVLNPGSYELNTNTNASQYITKPESYIERKTPLLSNVLIAAGGITSNADLQNIEIYNSFTKQTRIANIYDLLTNNASDEDIYLMTGDRINVPELPSTLVVDMEKYKKYSKSTFAPKTIPVRVIGYVANPGLIHLESAQSLNLNSAIAEAGGYSSASPYPPGMVYLSRIDSNGNMVTKAFNPMKKDVVLLPNDIVFVPEKLRPKIGKAFDYLSRITMPFNVFTGGYTRW